MLTDFLGEKSQRDLATGEGLGSPLKNPSRRKAFPLEPSLSSSPIVPPAPGSAPDGP
jgi:hypothetical protein